MHPLQTNRSCKETCSSASLDRGGLGGARRGAAASEAAASLLASAASVATAGAALADGLTSGELAPPTA